MHRNWSMCRALDLRKCIALSWCTELTSCLSESLKHLSGHAHSIFYCISPDGSCIVGSENGESHFEFSGLSTVCSHHKKVSQVPNTPTSYHLHYSWKKPTIHQSPWHIFSPTSRFSGGSFKQHKPLTRSVTQHPITSNPKNNSEMNKFWNQLLWQAGTLCWTGVPGELYSRANSSWLHLPKVPKLFDCCICRVPRQMDTESVRSPLGLHLSLPY